MILVAVPLLVLARLAMAVAVLARLLALGRFVIVARQLGADQLAGFLIERRLHAGAAFAVDEPHFVFVVVLLQGVRVIAHGVDLAPSWLRSRSLVLAGAHLVERRPDRWRRSSQTTDNGDHGQYRNNPHVKSPFQGTALMPF